MIAHIEDDGTIVRNEKVYEGFVCANLVDIPYGNAVYEVPSTTRRAAPKLPITAVQPVAQLKEKLAPYIEWYKEYWPQMVSLENYKWQATEQFQRVFDITEPNLSENLKTALSKEVNLLSGKWNYSKDTLLKNAAISTEEVRSALTMLFDETIDFATRAYDFVSQFTAIHEANKSAGLINLKENVHQNPHSVSVYLAFAHPSLHYIYKESVWKHFVAETEIEYPSLSRFAHKLVGHEQVCEQIRGVLTADEVLVALHNEAYPSDSSNYHLLTQDFIYAIAEHFQGFGKGSRYYEEPA